MRRVIALAIGVICGAELIAVAVIGGAGLSALFGWEGLVVTAAASVLLFEATRRTRTDATSR